MADRKMSNAVAVAVALVALLAVATAAGAAGLCGVDRKALEACRSYCTKGSQEKAPTPDCCKSVSHANFQCLCTYKSYLPSDIDGDRALDIPLECTGQRVSC